ncbi:hypothetical protein KP509_38G065900 [Ceratopteris richardii]|nr:hypothetical protein KP509_38G065900 [Ceratopteris richardii]
MALEERGLPFVITGIDEQSMPSWLTEINKNAEIPALRDGDEYVFGADDILSHVNDRYPEQSSAFLVPEAQLQQIETITSALVETFMKWMESKSKDSPVRTEYEDAVVELNKHLEKNGPYLCGTSPTDADFKVAPLLHHARVTLLNVMDFELPKKYAAVHKYIALMEGRASFQKYNQPDELIVSSWQRKFGMQAQTA